MSYRLLAEFFQLMHTKGVGQAVISPGSRSAPLAICAAQHPGIETLVVPDERSAAYTALGMALATRKPLALICTSGTAPLNYGPAVAEAWYSEVPLLLLTADRPPEWIDQQDNQAIRQDHLYRNCKAYYRFPSLEEAGPDTPWWANRLANEALNKALARPEGPVQINFPFRKPFYPEAPIDFPEKVRNLQEVSSVFELGDPDYESLYFQLSKEFKAIGRGNAVLEPVHRILVAIGQGDFDWETQTAIRRFSDYTGAIVVADPLANIRHIPTVIHHPDLAAHFQVPEKLAPELLITLGRGFLSKKLKELLRQHPPEQHWHLQPAGEAADTFRSLTHLLRVEPYQFFSRFEKDGVYNYLHPADEAQDYSRAWQEAEQEARERAPQVLATFQAFNQLEAIRLLCNSIEAGSGLFFGNSLPVRWAAFLGDWLAQQDFQLWANRGTSGIDGCLSTALGLARNTEQPVWAFLGDQSFFYDRNALWQKSLPKNLSIVVLNNGGGGIFRVVPGPAQQAERAELFENQGYHSAAHAAKEFGLGYAYAKSREDLDAIVEQAGPHKPRLLEVFTDPEQDTYLWQSLYRRS